MSFMGNIKIEDKTLNRLRQFVANKYGGQMWGKIGSEIETALNTYLDIEELKLQK